MALLSNCTLKVGAAAVVAAYFRGQNIVQTYAALTLPPIFSWFGYQLFANNKTSYHPDEFRPSGKTYFVKPASQGGNDANDGLTWETALATPITAARKSDCVLVQLASGRYPNAYWGDSPAWPASFRGMACDTGIAEFLAGNLDDTANFAADASNPGAYKWSGAGTIYSVRDEANPTSFGTWGWLTRQASTAAVAASGGWYSNGTDLWVKLTDNRAPDSSVRVSRTRRCRVGKNSIAHYFKGIHFHGGSLVADLTQTTAGSLHLYRCHVGYTGTTDDAAFLMNHPTIKSYLYECKVYGSEKDLISYQDAAYGFEYGCESFDAPVAGSNNASTAHGVCNVISVASYYHDTANDVVVDVSTGGNAGRLLLGCISRNASASSGSDYNSSGSPMYLINCRNFAGSISDYAMEGNGAKFFQNTELVGPIINATPTTVELYTGPYVTPSLDDWS